MPNRAGAGGALDPFADALIGRMTTKPSFARAALISETIDALRAVGLWDLFDTFWVMAAHDAQAARLNWRGVTGYDLVAVGSPAFTIDRGYAGDGASAYFNTNYQPAGAGKWQLTSASVHAWCRTAAPTGILLGGFSGYGYIQVSGPTLLGGTNRQVSGTISGSVANGQGLLSISTTASAQTEGYRDGVSVDTDTNAQTAYPNTALKVLSGSYGDGSPNNIANAQIAFAGHAAGMTSAQVAALHTILLSYMQAVGAA